MTKEDRQQIYEALAAPFPESCVQRTNGRTTGRGYDTTGIGYQHVVDRFNEVLGVGGFQVADRKMTLKEVATTKGRPAFEAICELKLQIGEWSNGQFVPFAEAIADGGHMAVAAADAMKGAFTNGFKKAAAFFGVGREAYAGTLDDDNVFRGEEPDQPRDAEGRCTQAQMKKLEELTAEAGIDWRTFRDSVRRRFDVNVEYADRRLASQLISELIAQLRKARGNGRGSHGSNDGRTW